MASSVLQMIRNFMEVLLGFISFVFFGTSAQRLFAPFYKLGKVPWDIKGPQPAIVSAEKQGVFTGKVLDVGTGPGDNAIFLAQSGHQVTALDLTEDALKIARERAAAAGPPAMGNVTFKQADLLDPVSLRTALGHGQWDTVLDSAVFHCFVQPEQQTYAASLANYVKPGGRLVMFVFSDKNPKGWVSPQHISRERIRQVFNKRSGWKVESMEDREFKVGQAPGLLAWVVPHKDALALLAVITKL